MVDHLGRWDAVSHVELLEGMPSTSSAPPMFPKQRQFSWWQVMGECQMKHAHAGKRVIKRHWRRSSSMSTIKIHSRCDIDLSRDDGVIFMRRRGLSYPWATA